LGRRYLAGHAPADARDLARWAALPLGEARQALTGARAPAGGPVPALPPPRLLGGFEPVLLGWTSREDVVGPHLQLVTTNGLFRPFAMVEGRAVATWSLAGGRVAVTPLEPYDDDVAQTLADDADAVLAYLS
ncbi:MAG: hypothetical protein JWM64_1587, partial [Frankiales bacterium]|nr:hypothetical protein [Frankiales bacterium]